MMIIIIVSIDYLDECEDDHHHENHDDGDDDDVEHDDYNNDRLANLSG